jgi:hypothetical protein
MLGRLHMSVDQCIEAYLHLSKELFNPMQEKRNILSSRSSYSEKFLSTLDLVRGLIGKEPLLSNNSPCKVYENLF